MRFNKILLLSLLFPFLLTSQSCTTPDTEQADKELSERPDPMKSEKADDRPVVLFFGNSLTAAYGLDPDQGFPALIQQRYDSLGKAVKVINAGVTGETSATGLSRVQWVLDQGKISVFVLELGANDGLRGIPVTETEDNLRQIIQAVKKNYPEARIVLAGMMVPPNMGPEYSEAFTAMYPRIASTESVEFIPFLLDGVAGEPSLNLPDGIHPNEKGQQIVAENVWAVLKGML
jgi:acyl-CoA thioesterase-1